MRLFSGGILASGVVGAGSYVYGRAIERHRAVVERVEVKLRGLAPVFDGWRVVQLSDLHLEPNYDPRLLTSTVAIINGLNPHVITMTGDYVTSKATTLARRSEPLADLKAQVAKVASLGNHDVWSSSALVTAALAGHGFQVLNNEGQGFTRQGETLWLAGLDSCWGGRAAVVQSLRGSPRGAPCIMLSHEPDHVDVMAPQAAMAGAGGILQLAGHTHGGQICLPGGIPLRLPKWGKKYAKGLFQINPLVQLYVNRGLGTIGPRARFACSPEITEITLRCA